MLEILQREARVRAEWQEYANYCRLRIQGKRPQALDCLKAFVECTKRWEQSEKRDFVIWLLEHLQEYPITSQCPAFDEPLTGSLIHPVLLNWSNDQGNDPRPFRWLGMFFENQQAELNLNRAIELDDAEQLARVVLLGRYFDHLFRATEHVDQKRYVGDISADMKLIEKAFELIQGIDDEITRVYWKHLFDDKKHTLDRWLSRK